MATYTVKAGDTSSGIASRLGVKVGDLTGFRSKNPSLIYPGETLTYGNASPAASSAPSSPGSGDYSGLDKFLGDFSTGQQALIDRLKTEQDSQFGEYEAKLNSQEKLSDAYKRVSGETGLTDYTAKVGALQDKLSNLDKEITDRTTGSFTDEGQRQNTVAGEAAPLNRDLSKFSYAKAAAQEQVGNQVNLISQDQQRELEPLKMKISAFSERAAREMTGFSTGKTNELNLLLEKLHRTQELSDREWQRTEQLAAEERDFAHQKELISIKANADSQGSLTTDKLNQWLDEFNGGTKNSSSSSASYDSVLDNIFGQPTPTLSVTTANPGSIQGVTTANPQGKLSIAPPAVQPTLSVRR